MMYRITLLLVLFVYVGSCDYLQCTTNTLEFYLRASGLFVNYTVDSGVTNFYTLSGYGIYTFYSKTSIGGMDIINGYTQWNILGTTTYFIIGISCGTLIGATLTEADVNAYLSSFSPVSSTFGKQAAMSVIPWDYALNTATYGNCTCVGPNVNDY